MSLPQYSLVRIRMLLRAPDSYDGWRVNQRAPQIGDRGTIVDILQAPSMPDLYVVESSDPGGITSWLGEFTAEELEPVEA